MRALRRVLLALVALALVGAAAAWALSAPQTLPEGPEPSRTADLANGERLFWAGGCSSCHATPGQEDRRHLGGGLALETPFGTFRVPNLSPHPEKGIGRWSAANFANAMRRGVSPDGRHYYPAFPYTSYQRMLPDDVADLFVYLRTLPAVDTDNAPHDLPFPVNIRRGIGLWKRLHLDGESFRPDPARDAAWNRGGYLVEGPGHCNECHTPRDITGGLDRSRAFAGAPEPEGRGFVPNITPEALKWSAAEIAEMLASGFTPEFDSVGGSMADVVRNTAQLPAADREAMAAYLKSLPPRPTTPRPAATPADPGPPTR